MSDQVFDGKPRLRTLNADISFQEAADAISVTMNMTVLTNSNGKTFLCF